MPRFAGASPDRRCNVKCPIHGAPMQVVCNDAVSGHQCEECDGVFYPGSYVRAFRLNYHSDALEDLSALGEGRPGHLTCPACNTDMRLLDVAEVEIDHCPRCGGIWFDQYELESVIDRVGTRPRSRALISVDGLSELPNELRSLLILFFRGGGGC